LATRLLVVFPGERAAACQWVGAAGKPRRAVALKYSLCHLLGLFCWTPGGLGSEIHRRPQKELPGAAAWVFSFCRMQSSCYSL